jgi:Zn-dependent protease
VIARPFGIPVYISPYWFLIAGLFILLYANSLERSVSGNLRYLVSALFVVLLYASVLVHELSHCVVARAFHLPVRRILLYPLGGFSEIEKEAPTPAREFLVAAAGPAVSLVLAAVGYGLSRLVPAGTAHVLVIQLVWANLLVGLFNLLPGLPLDGGRMLRAGVWAVTGKRRFGTRAAVVGGAAVAIGLVVWALSGLVAGTADQWLRLGVCVLTAWFVVIGASAELAAEQRHSWPDGMTLAEILRPILQLPAESAVADALIAAAGRGVVLVRPDGVAAGLLDEVAARQLAGHAPMAPAEDAAMPIRPDTVLFDSETGEDIIDRVRETAAFQFLVVDDDGKPAGVLRREDLNAALSARRMP